MLRIALTLVSRNRKTGPMPVTSTSRDSCPRECPLINGAGCYADAGYYTRLAWNRVSEGRTGMIWSEFLVALARLPSRTFWRHNVAGDLPGVPGGRYTRLDRRKCRDLTDAARHTKPFTYTHYPLTGHNVQTLREMNAAGFVVNVSCDSLDEIDHARSRGLPVVTIVSEDTRKTRTIGKHKAVICPATTQNTNCNLCRLCAKPDRDVVIGFPAHGQTRRKIIPITAQ